MIGRRLYRPTRPLPWWLRSEIRLVSWLIPLINACCSPQRAASLLRPKRERRPPSDTYATDLVCHVGRLLEGSVLMRERHCLRRSYLLYRYLRRFGIPAILNFGLQGDERPEGHCWIMVDEALFFDESEPEKEFTHLVGAEGDVQYWI